MLHICRVFWESYRSDVVVLVNCCLGKTRYTRIVFQHFNTWHLIQVMDVAMGTRAGFLQDAVSLNLGEAGNRSSLNVLGHVRHKMVVTPNWDNLLSARATVES